MDYLNAIVLIGNYILIPGMVYGSQLALGALGVTLIYGILRFSNFAHGELMSFGAMMTIIVTWQFQAANIGLGVLPTALLAIPFGAIAAILLSLFTDRFIYRFFRTKKAPPVTYIILSLGIMFIFSGIIRLIIGPQDRLFTDGERFIIKARDFKAWSGLDQGLALKMTQGGTVIVTIIAMIALFWFLNRTRTGKSMRAYSDNADLALLSGINPEKIVRIAWILTAIMATIAGVLYGLDKSYKPFIFHQLLLPIFAAAIVGGIGSPIGAVVGGFVVAFSEIVITFAYTRVISYLVPTAFIPDGLVQLLSTDYKFAVSFVLLVTVLLIRPTGLFRG